MPCDLSDKGQKNAIQKALQKVGVIKPPKKTDRGRLEFDDGMIVSTVDRYQGDENDIVILSLVRTKPGNLFLQLINRFIVATSRARIGFYIIGTVDAVTKSSSGNKGPEHWCDLVSHLKQGRLPLATDESEQDGAVPTCPACEGAEETPPLPQLRAGKCGTGRAFPICCPRHPANGIEVTCGCSEPKCPKAHFPRSLKDSFCAERCTNVLRWCGHACGVPCHSPVSVQHTKPESCDQALQRPCDTHANVPLACGMVFKARHETKGSLVEALEVGFECDVQVEHHRPECLHVVKMTCNLQKKLVAGETELPPCKESVEDFFHPACNHRSKKPSCHERRQWEATPPRCLQLVMHVKPCGCQAQLRCFETAAAAADLAPCQRGVNMYRPRCSHNLSLRCYERTALLERWEQSHGMAASKAGGLVSVSHGEAYGPAEEELRTVVHPRQIGEPIGLPDVQFRTAVPACSVFVNYVAECGHTIPNVPCSQAFLWADPATSAAPPPCRQRVKVQSVLCGHEVVLECSVAESKAWRSIVPVGNSAALPEGRLKEIVQEAVAEPAVGRALSGLCNEQVIVLRDCGHVSQLPCKRLLPMLRANKLPKCKEQVKRVLKDCGHEVPVDCSKKDGVEPDCQQTVAEPFVFACGKHRICPGTCSKLRTMKLEQPPCQTQVQCALFRCGHTASVSCRLEPAVVAAQPGGKHFESGEAPVVVANEGYCLPCADAPPCDKDVTFRDACGHDRPGTPCEVAFRWAAAPDEAPPCEMATQLASPLCSHMLHVKCHEAEVLGSFDLWGGLEPWRPSMTTSLDESGIAMEMILVDNTASRPQLDQLSVTERKLLKCGAESMVERLCGHTETVSCVDALKELLDGRCFREVTFELPCSHSARLQCHRARLIESDAAVHFCDEKVIKTCGRCGVNKCEVACSHRDVLCESEVEAPLPCGHVVRWTCGDENDPRSDRTKACAECVLHQWQAASVGAEPADELQLARKAQQMQWTIEQLRDFACKRIPDAIVVVQRQVSDQQQLGLADAHQQLLRIGCDLLSTQIANEELWEADKAAPPTLSDFGCFDVVFCLLQEPGKDDERINRIFGQSDTVYGRGVQIFLLNAANLKKLGKSGLATDLSVRICVGVAFRFSALDGTMPFRKKASTQQRKPKRKGQKGQISEGDLAQKANKMQQNALAGGKDYVVPFIRDDPSAAENVRVYWVPGAVVPLCVATIQLFHECGVCRKSFVWSDGGPATQHDFLCAGCTRDCCICFDKHSVKGGLACASQEQHFMCDECLEGHVTHASSHEALEAFRRNNGVKCPVRRAHPTDRTPSSHQPHAISAGSTGAWLHCAVFRGERPRTVSEGCFRSVHESEAERCRAADRRRYGGARRGGPRRRNERI